MIRLNTEPKKIENFCMNGYYFSFDSFDEDSKKNFFYFANQIILNENFSSQLEENKLPFIDMITEMYLFKNIPMAYNAKRSIKSLFHCLNYISYKKHLKIIIYIDENTKFYISIKGNKFILKNNDKEILIEKNTKLEICTYFQNMCIKDFDKKFHKIIIGNKKDEIVIYHHFSGLIVDNFYPENYDKKDKYIIYRLPTIEFTLKKSDYYFDKNIVPYIIDQTKNHEDYYDNFSKYYCLKNDGIVVLNKRYVKIGNKKYFEIDNFDRENKNLSFIFSRDEKFLFVSNNYECEIKMLNRENQKITLIKLYEDTTLGPIILEVYKDNKTIIYSSKSSKKTYIYNYETEKILKIIDGFYDKGIFSIDFSLFVIYNQKDYNFLVLNELDGKRDVIYESKVFFDFIGINAQNIIQVFSENTIIQYIRTQDILSRINTITFDENKKFDFGHTEPPTVKDVDKDENEYEYENEYENEYEYDEEYEKGDDEDDEDKHKDENEYDEYEKVDEVHTPTPVPTPPRVRKQFDKNNFRFDLVKYSKDRKYLIFDIGENFYLADFEMNIIDITDKISKMFKSVKSSIGSYFADKRNSNFYEIENNFPGIPFVFSQKNKYILYINREKEVIKIDIKKYVNIKKNNFILGFIDHPNNDSNIKKHFIKNETYEKNLIRDIIDYIGN